MPEGPAQTPVAFVKGSGMANWSAKCIEELIAAGFEPHWFGTHEHTSSQIRAAQESVADWKAGKGPKPPDSDFYLSRCQAGHLSQDAIHRKPKTRGNACGNLYDGYDVIEAPCMPQSGGAGWSGTEHDLASRHESACAHAVRAEGNKEPGQYPDGLRQEHERDRIDKIVKHEEPNEVVELRKDGSKETRTLEAHERRRPLTEKEYEANQQARAGGATPAQGPGAVQRGADDGITGNDAEECIESFKEQGLQSMRDSVREERAAAAADNRALDNPKARGDAQAATAGAKANRDAEAGKAEGIARRDGQIQANATKRAQEAGDAREEADRARGDPATDKSEQRRLDAMATRLDKDATRREHEANRTGRKRADGEASAADAQKKLDAAERHEARVNQADCLASEGERKLAGDDSRATPKYTAPVYPAVSPVKASAASDAAGWGISGSEE